MWYIEAYFEILGWQPVTDGDQGKAMAQRVFDLMKASPLHKGRKLRLIQVADSFN